MLAVFERLQNGVRGILPPKPPKRSCRKMLMGYKIKKVGQQKWAVYLHKGNNNWTYVPKEAWPKGLKKGWSIEQARSFTKSLTAKDQEYKRTRITKERRRSLRIASAYLPPDVVDLFYSVAIEPNLDKYGKTASLWAAVQKHIVALKVTPEYWALNPNLIYNEITKQPKSIDWAGRILRMLNKWGYTYCVSRKLAWQPIEKLPERYLAKLHDDAERAELGQTSRPITFEELNGLKGKLKEEHWAWTNLAFWFGLRPQEVDQLKERSDKWSIEGFVLKIWQPKLRKVKAIRRYKYIPAQLDIQKHWLERLKTGLALSRPSRSVVARAYPLGVTNYGFRHGFTSYMEQCGVDMKVVSRWLGHTTLQTTERYYRDLNIIKYHEEH